MNTKETGATSTGTVHRIRVSFKELTHSERSDLLAKIITLKEKEQLSKYLLTCSFLQLSNLTKYISTTLVFEFENLDKDLYYHRRQIRNDKNYEKLLELGASNDIIYGLFTKSRRQIKADRVRLGLGKKFTGRPKAIDTTTAYEITSRWAQVCDEGPSHVEALIVLAEEFPQQDVTSIYKLVKGD